MGILDDYKQKNLNKHTTKGIYFGAPEAEAENLSGHSLSDYFDDFLGILTDLEQLKFIFIGRKGVGKSAIAKFLKDKSDKSEDSWATLLKLSDYKTETVIQQQEEHKQSEYDSLLFEWLILINIVKLILKSGNGYTLEYEKLQTFIDKNSGLVAIDKFQITEAFEKTGGEIKFGVLTHAFGGIFKKYFDVKVSKAPFYQLIPPLKEVVQKILNYEVNQSSEFWILFDDLDINFDIKNVRDRNLIIELIRIAKNYNNDILKNTGVKVLIFLRDDIRNALISEYSDSAKLFNSYEILINWYKDNVTNENDLPIKKLVERRIQIGFKNKGIRIANGISPWDSLFADDNYSSAYPKSSFKYILDFTFYRPRDFITLLNVISQEEYNYPIKMNSVKRIINRYVAINIKEIKSELSLYFTEKEKGLLFNDLFCYIIDNQPTFTKATLKIKDLFPLREDDIMEILFSYNLFVLQKEDGTEIYVSYRDNRLDTLKKEELKILLHKCIYTYYKKLM
jgi:hypothetical protein